MKNSCTLSSTNEGADWIMRIGSDVATVVVADCIAIVFEYLMWYGVDGVDSDHDLDYELVIGFWLDDRD
jgi:hypothetical protein